MTLPTSGAISLNQMHVEAGGQSGTIVSINDSDVRSLIGKSSGNTSSFSQFYGASNALETQTVTVGYSAGNDYVNAFYGTGYAGIPLFYDDVRNVGSLSDGTLSIRSNKYILNLYWRTNLQVVLQLQNDGSTITNAGFTTMSVGGQSFSRSSATFSHSAVGGATGSNNFTSWIWSSINTNPFGTTTGATKAVVFT